METKLSKEQELKLKKIRLDVAVGNLNNISSEDWQLLFDNCVVSED